MIALTQPTRLFIKHVHGEDPNATLLDALRIAQALESDIIPIVEQEANPGDEPDNISGDGIIREIANVVQSQAGKRRENPDLYWCLGYHG